MAGILVVERAQNRGRIDQRPGQSCLPLGTSLDHKLAPAEDESAPVLCPPFLADGPARRRGVNDPSWPADRHALVVKQMDLVQRMRT